MKIKTELLKDIVAKNYKLSEGGSNKVPITQFFEIMIEDGKLIVKSTDKLNTLITITEIEDKEAKLRTAVDAKIFSQLISKITTEYVELVSTENSLTITGNGVYELKIGLDESGAIISLPNIDYDINKANKEISFKELSAKISICQPSMPTTLDEPELNNYYLGENIVSTNCFKISSIPNIEALKQDSIFIGENLGKYISTLEFDKCKVYAEGNKVYFIGDNFVLSGSTDDDLINRYPLEAIKDILSSEFTSNATIKRSELLELLDRLSLFVEAYDENNITLTFMKDHISVKSRANNGSEDINYTKANTDNLIEFTCKVDILNLKAQLASLINEEVEISFGGNDNIIKIRDGEIVDILSLLEE